MTRRRLEVVTRYADDGSLDELVLTGPGGCEFHLERLSDVRGEWWMKFYSVPDRPLPHDMTVRIAGGRAAFETEEPFPEG